VEAGGGEVLRGLEDLLNVLERLLTLFVMVLEFLELRAALLVHTAVAEEENEENMPLFAVELAGEIENKRAKGLDKKLTAQFLVFQRVIAK